MFARDLFRNSQSRAAAGNRPTPCSSQRSLLLTGHPRAQRCLHTTSNHSGVPHGAWKPPGQRSSTTAATRPHTTLIQPASATIVLEQPQQRQSQGKKRTSCHLPQQDDIQQPKAAQYHHDAAPAPATDAASLQLPSNNDPYIPANTSAGRNRQLTVHISRRRHWTQLQQIWLDSSTTLTHIHLTAVITRLARLVDLQGVKPPDRPELFKFSSAIMSSIRQSIPTLDSRGAAQCLWAYARLQYLSPHSSRTGDAAAVALVTAISQQHMQLLNGQELSQICWAAAVLVPAGLQLPSLWWVALQQRLLLLLPDMAAAEVACCAWAIAKIHLQPSQQVATAFMQQTAADMELYGVRELVQVITAATAWKIEPPASWMAVCSRRLELLSTDMQPLDTSSLLLALANLHQALVSCCSEPLTQQQLQQQGHSPVATAAAAVTVPLNLVRTLLQQLLQQLPYSCPRVLVSVPYALARLGVSPGSRFWATYLPYTAAALHCCDAPGLAILAWSLGRLGIKAQQGWIQEFVVQSRSKISGFAAQELSMLLWGLGKMGAGVSHHWWLRFEQVSGDQLENFTAAELAAMLHGIAGTVAPDSQSPAAAAAVQQQQQCYTFSSSWTAKLLAASEVSLSEAPAGCLAGILTGLAKLCIRPSSQWFAVFESAAVAAVPAASFSQVAAITWGYVVLEMQPPKKLLSALYARIDSILQDQQQHRQLFAQQYGSSSSVEGILARSRSSISRSDQQQQVLSSMAAAQLLWSVAHLPDRVGAPWVDDVLHLVTPALSSASSHTLVTLLRALARLGHTPGSRIWIDAWWQAYAMHLQKIVQQHSMLAECSSRMIQQHRGQQRRRRQQQYVGEDYSHPCAGMAAVLWSFGRLGVTPRAATAAAAADNHWLQLLLDASQPLLGSASVVQLWGLLSQLVRLHVWPGDSWLAEAADAVRQHQQRLNQQRYLLAQEPRAQQQQQEQYGVLLERSALEKAVRHLERLGCSSVRPSVVSG